MRIYGYLRIDPESSGVISNDFNYFKKYGYFIEKKRLICEEVAIDTPIFYRDKILNLVTYTLEEDDILIIKGLDSLGVSFGEISQFVDILDSKKIILICLDYSRVEIKGDIKKIFSHFLKMGAKFEMNFKNYKKYNVKSNIVKRVGRPEILNNSQKREVIVKFKKGCSVNSIAKEYSVTRSVIQRLLNKETEKLTLFKIK